MPKLIVSILTIFVVLTLICGIMVEFGSSDYDSDEMSFEIPDLPLLGTVTVVPAKGPKWCYSLYLGLVDSPIAEKIIRLGFLFSIGIIGGLLGGKIGANAKKIKSE